MPQKSALTDPAFYLLTEFQKRGLIYSGSFLKRSHNIQVGDKSFRMASMRALTARGYVERSPAEDKRHSKHPVIITQFAWRITDIGWRVNTGLKLYDAK